MLMDVGLVVIRLYNCMYIFARLLDYQTVTKWLLDKLADRPASKA